jgi:hypothetical protein
MSEEEQAAIDDSLRYETPNDKLHREYGCSRTRPGYILSRLVWVCRKRLSTDSVAVRHLNVELEELAKWSPDSWASLPSDTLRTTSSEPLLPRDRVCEDGAYWQWSRGMAGGRVAEQYWTSRSESCHSRSLRRLYYEDRVWILFRAADSLARISKDAA